MPFLDSFRVADNRKVIESTSTVWKKSAQGLSYPAAADNSLETSCWVFSGSFGDENLAFLHEN
jgi:hypothetical protein